MEAAWASNPCGDRRANLVAGRQRMLAVALVPELLPCLAPLDLLAQGGGNCEPNRFQRVVASFGMDVRSGHSQRYKRAEGRGVVLPVFQYYRRDGHWNEALQAFEWLFQPTAQIGVEVETENVELDFHSSEMGSGV